MDSKRKINLFVLCVLMIVLLALVGTSSQAASQSQGFVSSDSSSINRPSGGGGNIGGYPLYDSEWHEVGTRPEAIVVMFNHNLGGDPDTYLVKLECRDDTEVLTYDCVSQGFTVDAHWYGLTNSTVSVYVKGGTRPDYIRVRIYGEGPVYDSGWDEIGTHPDPLPRLYEHNLGGDPDTYLVGLECRDDTELLTYDCVSHMFTVNAYWYALTNTNVYVYVKGGPLPDYVRVRVYTSTPAYDSGWDEIGTHPDPLPLYYEHNLGGNPDMYYVDLGCLDDTSLQTHQCVDQSFSFNAHWYALSDASISVYADGGTIPDYARVRIWTTYWLFLPMVERE